MEDKIEIKVFESGQNLVLSWEGTKQELPGVIFQLFSALKMPIKELIFFHG